MKEYKVYAPHVVNFDFDDRNKQIIESDLNNFAQQGYRIVGVASINSGSKELNIFLERDIPDKE